MPKYRSDKHEVDAFQWTGLGIGEPPPHPTWIIKAVDDRRIKKIDNNLIINTKDGWMECIPDDHVALDADGNLIVVKHQVFIMQYKRTI